MGERRWWQETLYLSETILCCTRQEKATGKFWQKECRSTKLVQLLYDSHSHLLGLHEPNLKTKQNRIDAFMETIGKTVYPEEFGNQDRTRIDQKFYLEASSPCPLIAYKFNINFTVYNVDAAMTNYFYHFNNKIVRWANNSFCKPVVNSVALLLHDCH